MKMLTRFASRQCGLWALVPLLSMAALAGCGGGGGNGATATPTPAPTPTVSPSPSASLPSVALGADNGEVLRGQATTLQWSAQNASAVTASNFGATTLSGSMIVHPNESTTYTLSVRNSGGQVATNSVTVHVASVDVVATPNTAVVDVSAVVPLVVQVHGAVDTGVAWTVQESGAGSVAPDGTYSAPATAGIYHILATSNADPSKVTVIEVRVRAASGTISVN